MAKGAGGERRSGSNHNHFRVERFQGTAVYSPPLRDLSGAAKWPDRMAHGPRLETELAAALTHATEQLRTLDGPARGVYLEVRSAADSQLADLTWKREGIRFGAVRPIDETRQLGSLFVPATAQTFLRLKVHEYATDNTPSGDPKHQEKFGHVDRIRPGTLESIWTDVRSLPEDGELIWWECWCWSDRAVDLVRAARANNFLVSERRLHFPEYEVVPIYGHRGSISDLIRTTGAVEELRHASDSPTFFMVTARREQRAWVNDLADRIAAPEAEAPRVCLLDNGVANEHPLLAQAISAANCHSVDAEWGLHDHDLHGHGTNMAGCVLYGDLTHALADRRQIDLRKRLESVKFMPPPGFIQADPMTCGAITQQAIHIPEVADPDHRRVFCMAVTNLDVSGERPSSWSAALDQACAGNMRGDALGKQRLVIIAAGNIQDSSDPDAISDADEFPIEDPAQSWNALAVGGYTEKVQIAPEDRLDGWQAVAQAGDLSPFSRISTDWDHSVTPIKPELVLEAGNRAINEGRTEVVAGAPSLSLLTTERDFLHQPPLTTFWATSAATAQAAGMAADVMAEHPDLWPETIRALMVHSAEWTPAMRARLNACSGKRERVKLLRHFGYGVPSLDRALHSARSDLALIAQSHITPFKRERRPDAEGDMTLRGPTFNEIHYYSLPWPRSTLELLGERRVVRLKIVLSYFVEPSPGDIAPVSPSRYQSFGLRFDLKRATDTPDIFRKRVNKLEREAGEQLSPAEADSNWMFGSQHVAAGSLHVDVWTGRAADLAAMNEIAVYPVAGWWKNRTAQHRYDSETRYGLVVSLSSSDQTIDLYSEVQQKIELNAGAITVEVEARG